MTGIFARRLDRSGKIHSPFVGRMRAAALALTILLCLAPNMPAAAASEGIMDGLAQPQEGRSMRASSTRRIGPDGKPDPKGKPDPNSNWDNQNVEPGATAILLDEKGPGVVTHIWLTFLGPDPQGWAPKGSANHQEMLLRVFYDGEARPGVEAPVGDFFCNAFGKRSEVISLPVIVEDADSYNCFWRMPFRKSIRIEIENQSEKRISLLYFNIDWIQKKSIPSDAPYFYAQYRQEYPVKKGEDYVVLETKGKGHLVGVSLNVRTRSPAWFGEGDEKIWIDGEKDASIWGTGTEDYFLSAWGLKKTSTPYFGVPYFDQWGIVGGYTSAYRWHINDPIVFNTGIKVAFEHYGWLSPDENPNYKSDSWNEREDDYSSVAYWYQTGRSTFDASAPHARERKLPNLDLIFPVAEKPDAVSHGDGAGAVHKAVIFPQGHYLYRPIQAKDAWLEIPFEVKTKEPRRLLLKALRSYDYGRYQATLNGVPIGGIIDLYGENSEEWEVHLLDFWPEPGAYTLRLECVGKNPKSQGYYLGIESLRLRERRPRVAQYAHDKDKDWRAKPTLYK
ncbi:MAG: DUF2961 domain-containing protein [Candidatus Sumerlaeota bacterium]|nr:DUF2961 domain-containing protein [Candidatus Sumerlaeota bacterium]